MKLENETGNYEIASAAQWGHGGVGVSLVQLGKRCERLMTPDTTVESLNKFIVAEKAGLIVQ